jgi:hypothetical protein
VTKQEALNVLEQVRLKFTGTGADNDIIREALVTLQKETKPDLCED